MQYYLAPNVIDFHDKDQKQLLQKLKHKLLKGDKLITRYYEPQAYTYQTENGILGSVINMYDYFQNAVNVPARDLHVRLSGVFPLNDFNIIGINNNQSDIYYHGRKIAEVAIAPSTVQLIGTVSFLDRDGIVTSKDLYDRRGFLSSTQYFDHNGNFGHQVMYDPDGNPKMEIIVMKQADGQIGTTGIKLLNYQGADYLFDSENSLWDFFVKEIKHQEQAQEKQTRKSVQKLAKLKKKGRK